MGVVNVTPDSFSDGGRYLAADAAVAHGLQLDAGRRRRPRRRRRGDEPEGRADRRRGRARSGDSRHRGLVAAGANVSVDTTKAEVAAAAIAAGARLGQRRLGRPVRPGDARGDSRGHRVHLRAPPRSLDRRGVSRPRIEPARPGPGAGRGRARGPRSPRCRRTSARPRGSTPAWVSVREPTRPRTSSCFATPATSSARSVGP